MGFLARGGEGGARGVAAPAIAAVGAAGHNRPRAATQRGFMAPACIKESCCCVLQLYTAGTSPANCNCHVALPCQCCLVDRLGEFAVGAQMRGISLFPLVP